MRAFSRIDGEIATPMSVYPEYRATRSSFGRRGRRRRA